jgi:hypothetical protein
MSNCNANWINFAVPNRRGQSCRNPCGRLRSNWLGNTAYILSLTRYGLTTWASKIGSTVDPTRSGSRVRKRQTTKMSFVDLTPPAAKLEECVIEFESAAGGKMRIQWKPTAPPDWTSLLRAWRETEG